MQKKGGVLASEIVQYLNVNTSITRCCLLPRVACQWRQATVNDYSSAILRAVGGVLGGCSRAESGGLWEGACPDGGHIIVSARIVSVLAFGRDRPYSGDHDQLNSQQKPRPAERTINTVPRKGSQKMAKGVKARSPAGPAGMQSTWYHVRMWENRCVIHRRTACVVVELILLSICCRRRTYLQGGVPATGGTRCAANAGTLCIIGDCGDPPGVIKRFEELTMTHRYHACDYPVVRWPAFTAPLAAYACLFVFYMPHRVLLANNRALHFEWSCESPYSRR